MTTIGWLVFALLLSAKALVILAMALLVTRLMRDRSAAERHLVWVIASAAVLALPALALAGPSWRIGVPASWSTALERVSEPAVSEPAVRAAEPVVTSAPVIATQVRTADVAVTRVEQRERMSQALGTQVLEPASVSATADEAGALNDPRVRRDRNDTRAIHEPIVSGDVSDAGIATGPGLTAGSGAAASVERLTATASDGDVTAASFVALFAFLVAATWLSGTLLVCARLLAGLARVRRLARTARPLTDAALHARVSGMAAELGVRRPIRMLEGDAAAMPITFGVLRPALLLPSSARGWPRARQDAVLRHELEHVRRRDTLSQLIAELACAIYWFNPLMWRAAHLMRVEREHACDDAVLAAGSRASDYATDLLDIARTLRYDHATEVAAIAMAKASHLRVRVASLLDARRRRERASLRLMVPAWLGAAMLMIPLSSVVLEINRAAAVTDSALDDGSILQERQEPAARSPRRPKPQQPAAGVPAPVAAPAPAAALRAPAPAASPVPGSAVPAPMWLSPPVAPNAVPAPAWLAAPNAPPPAGAPWSAGPVPAAASSPPGPIRTSPQPAPAAPGPPPMGGARALPGLASPAPRASAGPQDCLTGRNTSINSNSNDDRRTTRWSGSDCSGEVIIEGDVRFDESFTTITGISRGGRVRITTTEDGVERRVTITPGNGGVAYDYAVDGNRQAFDAAGREWLSTTLLFMFRRLGFMADERAAAIIRQGGASALLAEAELLSGDHVRVPLSRGTRRHGEPRRRQPRPRARHRCAHDQQRPLSHCHHHGGCGPIHVHGRRA